MMFHGNKSCVCLTALIDGQSLKGAEIAAVLDVDFVRYSNNMLLQCHISNYLCIGHGSY